MKTALFILILMSSSISFAQALPVEAALSPLLWSFKNSGQPARWEKDEKPGTVGADIHLLQAWTINDSAPDVKVAVIDGGFNLEHPELKDEFQAGLQFDFLNHDAVIRPQKNSSDWATTWSNHGQLVSGIIGANGFNSIGVTGVARQVQLIPVQAIPENSDESDEDVASAIRWSVNHGAKIINCSFGKRKASPRLRQAVHYARIHNVLIVASAGNHAEDLGSHPIWPASYSAEFENVVSVAATDRNDEIWEGSNRGTAVDIAAPGSEIFSTDTGLFDPKTKTQTDYSSASGTSMASPHVSGVAALMLQLDPGLNAKDLKSILMRTADRPRSLAGQVKSGRLNAAAALESVRKTLLQQNCDYESAKQILTSEKNGYTAEWTIADAPALYRVYLSEKDQLYQKYRLWFQSQTSLDARGLLQLNNKVGTSLIGDEANDSQSNFVEQVKAGILINNKIISGSIGAIRKLQCLESIPFREFLKVHDLKVNPQEFSTLVMKKGATLKIIADLYETNDNETGAPRSLTMTKEVTRLKAEGWTLFIDLHNHPLNPESSSGDIGAEVAPSTADIGTYLESNPELALITNGRETIRLNRHDFANLKSLTH